MSIHYFFKKTILSIKSVILLSIIVTLGSATAVCADEPTNGAVFSVAPMNQMITLTPGETYEGNFQIINPGNNQHDFYYTLEIHPFTTANDGSITFTSKDNYNQIVDWITLYNSSGIIQPNEDHEVRFVIDVPEDAPAGGQYATIIVKSGEYAVENSSVDLNEVYKVDHLIYADVAGETIRKGDIINVKVPSFLFSGSIFGSSTIKNEGNVHSQATSTLQVFPIFSKEEVFTNEENPKKSWIMPGNTSLTQITWDNTPSLGIFHVIYNVEYEGVESKVDKYVIVCPLWLLIVLLTCLFVVIFSIIFGKKKDKK